MNTALGKPSKFELSVYRSDQSRTHEESEETKLTCVSHSVVCSRSGLRIEGEGKESPEGTLAPLEISIVSDVFTR